MAFPAFPINSLVSWYMQLGINLVIHKITALPLVFDNLILSTFELKFNPYVEIVIIPIAIGSTFYVLYLVVVTFCRAV